MIRIYIENLIRKYICERFGCKPKTRPYRYNKGCQVTACVRCGRRGYSLDDKHKNHMVLKRR